MTQQNAPYFPSNKRGGHATATVEEMSQWVLDAVSNDNVIRFVTDHDLDLRSIEDISELQDDPDNWTPGHAEMARCTLLTLSSGQQFKVTIQEL